LSDEAFPIADIADSTPDQGLPTDLYRAEADLNGELDAGLATSRQLASYSHPSYAGVGIVGGALFPMHSSEPFRYQNLDFLTQQLVL
jgi:hypothetical protein